MKELSIEDKAKRYDEAIERAKSKIKNNKDHVLYEYDILDIFTELKESEDERIRKEIISFLKSPFVNKNITDEKVSPWIAWLEKKGQKETDPRYENLEELLAADDIYQMAMNDDMVQEAKTKVINALSELEIGKLLGIEKQDEQEEPQVYETADGSVITYSESEGYKIVEPKFHEGDWIIRNNKYTGIPVQVIEFKGYYRCELNGEVVNLTLNDVHNNFHLWTIQDAKDGDVLVEDSCIFIIQKLGDNNTTAKTYCTLYDDGDFDDGSILYFDVDSTKPATKEQRDLLFQNMKEEGYEWDAEKKELRKIEQEQIIDYIVNLPKDNWEFVHEFVEKFGRIPKDEDELNVLVEYVLKRQKPSTWSDEDERILNGLISRLVRIGANTRTDSTSINYTFPREINWLKSLKDRIGG